MKTRGLTTFFFNSKKNKDFQEYEGKQYNPNFEFGGKVVEKVEDKYVVEIKNRLQTGDNLELIIPGEIESLKFVIEDLWDIETKEKITHVNPGKEGQKVIMRVPYECKNGWIIRRKK